MSPSKKHHLFLILSAAVLLSISIGTAYSGSVERIRRDELKADKDGMPGEQRLQKDVVLAANVKMTATMEVTTKGNGILEIGNLRLKVYDDHDDGIYYENELLNIDFVDIADDGKREMLISGIVCFTDDKGDKVLRREAVVYIYKLQANSKFKQVYTNTSFRIDE